jgi:hypothetical protein
MLAELLRSKLRAKLLGWLFTHPDQRYFVRQLEAVLKEEAGNLSRELARLAAIGVVKVKAEGRQKYYQANADSPVFSELRGLATKSFGLADILRDTLAPLVKKIRIAFVYGSQAAGKPTAASDVDVMVIGKATFAEVVSALSTAQEQVGREINPAVYPADEFRKKFSEGHHFLTSVLKRPKVFLIGSEDELEGLATKRLGR